MSRSNAIKLQDGMPFTRVDLQYDVLHTIFTDTQQVFTDPFPGPGTTTNKLCFRDLYVQAIFKSSKSSKVLKDKMKQSSQFATDFAMLCLLANTGRINTTMSFFPEMKTLIRTYHPIPALQKTNGSLQDAPRIKSILKASLLESEAKSSPTTPAEILSRATSGTVPPTTVPNLIFVLSGFSPSVGRAHLAEDVEFTDLFQPVFISSASRAKAFLWLCYHYLESSKSDPEDYDIGTTTGNPFCDSERPGIAPALVRLTEGEALQENVDSEEELIIRAKLMEQRKQILQAQRNKGLPPGLFGTKSEYRSGDEDDGAIETPNRKKTSASNADTNSSLQKERNIESSISSERSQLSRPRRDKDPTLEIPFNSYPAPFPHSRTPDPPARSRRYKPYSFDTSKKQHLKIQRTFVEHAWYVVNHSDPLADSDEELGDEHDYLDYAQRLRIITRLRGKETTPEPERRPI